MLVPFRVTALALVLATAARAEEPDDPLLAPVPPAEVQLDSWEHAVDGWGKQNTDLRISAQEVVRAAARWRSALSNVLPQINGSGLASFSLLQSPTGDNSATAALFGAAPYETLGLIAQLNVIDFRSWNGIATASDGEKAAKLALDDARRLLMVNLAQALLNVVTAERVAELNRSGLRDAHSRLGLATRANAAGASTELDLGRLRQDLEVARATVVTGDESLRQARETLGLALGMNQPVGVSQAFQLNGLREQIRGTCREIAKLEDRADQLAASKRVDVAHRGVLDVGAQFIPTLAVRSNAQIFVINGEGGGAFPIWNLQAVLTVPIWDGGNRYGLLRDAKAQEDQAEARRLAAQRQGTIDVARAQRNIEVAQRSRAIAQAALEQSTKTDTLTRKAFDAGLGTSLDLVTAATGLRSQQINLAIRDYDVLRAQLVALFALSNCPP